VPLRSSTRLGRRLALGVSVKVRVNVSVSVYMSFHAVARS